MTNHNLLLDQAYQRIIDDIDKNALICHAMMNGACDRAETYLRLCDEMMNIKRQREKNAQAVTKSYAAWQAKSLIEFGLKFYTARRKKKKD